MTDSETPCLFQLGTAGPANREFVDTMTETAALHTQDEAISFARKFVGSEAFSGLFREGMGLVEGTAAYLDGEGRDESKTLSRVAALAYATESMRLTTRLMQLASWLLLQRAVAEGEISAVEAQADRYRIRLSGAAASSSDQAIGMLPERLRGIIEQSMRLQERICHLDSVMSGEVATQPQLVVNPIASQLDLLQSAFARG